MFDILLQVLDDGRLTDGQGRTVDFTNTILILTSNLGSPILIDPTLPVEVEREQVMALVRQAFRPEFLNRLDDIVMFQALTEDDLAQIVELSVDALQRRLHERRLTLAVTQDARAWLAERGYDPLFGASGRCGGSSSPRSRTGSRWRCSPAACTTATSCGSTSRRTDPGSRSRAAAPPRRMPRHPVLPAPTRTTT